MCCHGAFGQYILNGSAKKVSCNCYTLTEETNTQSGSVWNSNKINLTQSFDFWFNVYLGCRDNNGADGIVFILQPISTSVGSTGEGMGFGGVQPSIGIALDTWQNANLSDPTFDHISIQANGQINHSSDLDGPVQASPLSENIEDCRWHVLRITWNAATKTLTAFFDGSQRVQKQVDLVGTIFGNDPNVYWGFTGATGGAVNLQQFCTALNPIIQTNLPGNNGCIGATVNFTESSESFAPIVSYNWNFGDGTTSNDKVPPPHTYAAPGRYPVSLKIKGQDGCEKDSTITVTVGSVPNAVLTVFDTCAPFAPRYQVVEDNLGVSYEWQLDGTSFSTEQKPRLPAPADGVHQFQVVVTSNFNCGPPASSEAAVTIKPHPAIEALTGNGCAGEPVLLVGEQIDNQTTISRWQWQFGDGGGASEQRTSHRYSNAGSYTARLWALAANGCASDTVTAVITVNTATAFAGADTAVILGQPFVLRGEGNGAFLWSPPVGLSDPTSPNPVATLQDNQQYLLTVTTAEGCTATDVVTVRTFKGPAIYVPTAFTPNGDGKNDILRPVYVGMKELKQFAVFNRWGQRQFFTNEMGRGWEGRTSMPGTYVWVVQAVEVSGRTITQKGTVTLIR